MTKAELDKKSLADLHALAVEAGVERYRMLSRAELVAKLADGDGDGSERPARGGRERSGRSDGGGERAERAEGERPARRRRSRGGRGRGGGGERNGGGERGERESTGRESSGREPRPRRERQPEAEREPEGERQPEPPQEREPAPSPAAASSEESSSRPRRRRRRRFGRRGKQGVTLQGLLLPAAGRQALLAAETREACTTLLRGIAADLSDESNGPDPVALLVDPSPEELADWRREAPKAEIVAAGQPRHADDALAQAVARASRGDDVILLVDSLTRLGEAYDDADAAKAFFDAGNKVSGSGSLTVVAALERPAS